MITNINNGEVANNILQWMLCKDYLGALQREPIFKNPPASLIYPKAPSSPKFPIRPDPPDRSAFDYSSEKEDVYQEKLKDFYRSADQYDLKFEEFRSLHQKYENDCKELLGKYKDQLDAYENEKQRMQIGKREIPSVHAEMSRLLENINKAAAAHVFVGVHTLYVKLREDAFDTTENKPQGSLLVTELPEWYLEGMRAVNKISPKVYLEALDLVRRNVIVQEWHTWSEACFSDMLRNRIEQ